MYKKVYHNLTITNKGAVNGLKVDKNLFGNQWVDCIFQIKNKNEIPIYGAYWTLFINRHKIKDGITNNEGIGGGKLSLKEQSSGIYIWWVEIEYDGRLYQSARWSFLWGKDLSTNIHLKPEIYKGISNRVTACTYGCQASCTSSCIYSCTSSCIDSCTRSCIYSCTSSCIDSCTSSCIYSCTSSQI